MQSNREKRPIKFQVRSRPPIVVPQQSGNDSLAARVVSNPKGKSQMVLCLGNVRDAGQI
jgi:hypothetical protein